MAYEHMVLLANTVGADPWLCVPHAASDDYVRRLAALVLASLRPDLTVYLEYSNEVWNGLFGQGVYAAAQGRALGLTGAGQPNCG